MSVLDINGRSCPCALLRITRQIWVRSGRIPPYVLTVCVDGRKRLVICPSSVYPLGNIFCYRLNSKFGGPQSRSRQHGEETFSSPAGNRNPISLPFVGHNDIKLSAMVTHCCFQWKSAVT